MNEFESHLEELRDSLAHKVERGWYYVYRGNWYGPCVSKELALEEGERRSGCSSFPFVGTVRYFDEDNDYWVTWDKRLLRR